MKDVGEFLAYAMKLEEEAALRFSELADVMQSFGNAEVCDFFRKMAEFSRMHLAEAKARAGFHKIPDMRPEDFKWPDIESPEATSYQAADAQMDIGQALAYALDSEKRGHAFYAGLITSPDPEIRAMAEEFAAEEAEHVAELERWVQRYGVAA